MSLGHGSRTRLLHAAGCAALAAAIGLVALVMPGLTVSDPQAAAPEGTRQFGEHVVLPAGIPERIGRAQEFDLGRLHAGVDTSVQITYQNVAQEPLQLLGAWADCACSHVTFDREGTLAPGGVGAVELRIRPSVRTAEFKGGVFVRTNLDGAARPTVVLLRADVMRGVVADRRLVDFGECVIGLEPEATIALTHDKVPMVSWGVVGVDLLDSRRTCEFRAEESDTGWLVAITLPAPDRLGRWVGQLTIHTTHPLRRTLHVPCVVRVRDHVEFEPGNVVIRIAPDEEVGSATVRLIERGDQWSVRHLKIDGACFRVVRQWRLDDSTYLAEIEARGHPGGEFPARGTLSATLECGEREDHRSTSVIAIE